MADTQNRRTSKRVATKTPAAMVEERETRGVRRKRETRTRLLEAAMTLMAQRGMEAVAINEITEAADVGFGSFYNHFESKEAIYATLVDTVFEAFANALDSITRGLSDPAEVIAVSVRYTLLRAREDSIWGQFLIREGFSARAMSRGLGQRLLRDMERGIHEKRFVVADPFIGFLSVGGTILSTIAAELNFVAPGAPASDTLAELGFSGENFSERTAAVLLQTLGIKRAEAEKIAKRPLPALEATTSGD